MGVTIRSKRYSCDIGYAGFNRFRSLVAEKVNDEFHKHYLSLFDSQITFLSKEEKKGYYKKHDAVTKEFMEKGVITKEVANFLYQSDCDGKIDRRQAKQIYDLIKECDDNLIFGYLGRVDCAKMFDLKKIFSDGTKVEWT